jgi:hypothetical protein
LVVTILIIVFDKVISQPELGEDYLVP